MTTSVQRLVPLGDGYALVIDRAMLERLKIDAETPVAVSVTGNTLTVARASDDERRKRFEDATRAVDERPGQDAAYVIDSTKARTELGWKPTVSLEEGLTDVVDWVNSNWAAIQAQPLEYRHAA